MSCEILVGLNVVDENEYTIYRERMLPILNRYGGNFVYDFDIANVRKSPLAHEVNRVFTIRFPNQAQREAFFSDEEYLQVRKQHFEPSVTHAAIMLVGDNLD